MPGRVRTRDTVVEYKLVNLGVDYPVVIMHLWMKVLNEVRTVNTSVYCD